MIFVILTFSLKNDSSLKTCYFAPELDPVAGNQVKTDRVPGSLGGLLKNELKSIPVRPHIWGGGNISTTISVLEETHPPHLGAGKRVAFQMIPSQTLVPTSGEVGWSKRQPLHSSPHLGAVDYSSFLADRGYTRCTESVQQILSGLSKIGQSRAALYAVSQNGDMPAYLIWVRGSRFNLLNFERVQRWR